MSTQGPTYIDHNGYLIPFGFSIDLLNSALEFQPKSNTIFICSYPKCGTTWMQNIVYLLMHAGESFPSNLQVDNVMPHLELSGSKFCENFPVIKTHLPRNFLHINPQAKYIVVARNPKDCCVSFYHHTRGFVTYYNYANGTFDDYFERFINGKVDFNDYFDHFQSWEPYLNDSNVFFCTYEQLKSDTKEIIKKLALFLGIEMDKNMLEKVLNNCSFASMKKDGQRWTDERPDDMPLFMRKGEIGDWRNHFTQEQSDRMDMKIKQYPLMNELWGKYM
ncbi:hypothetical protein I4U23_022292 [Adineta vaga]|nr:hypothetical protein I4U23_022292 [Adineta vaga]